MDDGKNDEIEFNINVVDADEIKCKGRGTGEKYGEYVNAVKRIIDSVNVKIAESGDSGKISYRLFDIVKLVRINERRKEQSLYWGLKYAFLVVGGLQVSLGRTKKLEPILTLQKAPVGYELAPSLRRDSKHESIVKEDKQEDDQIEENAENKRIITAKRRRQEDERDE